jgi:hypothetical protein
MSNSKEKITKEQLQVGTKVTYCPSHGHTENGIVKSLPEHNNDQVFVVYHCNNEWNRYFDYTAALTNISDLKIGW